MSENRARARGLFLFLRPPFLRPGISLLRLNVSAFLLFLAAAVVAVLSLPAYGGPAAAGNPGQLAFGSPRKAFDALVNAANSNDTNEMLAILGPGGKDIVSSGDVVADTMARQRFARSAKQGVTFRQLNKNTFLALAGKNGWTFPIPIIKKGGSWMFDTEEGRQEILNRRIGRNELNTIRTSLAYVGAQREYAKMMARADSGVLQYAQRFISHKGSRDGLYWPAGGNSPLGPLFARAAAAGNAPGQGPERRVPYYGYYFRILKSQGSHAPGGAIDYVVSGKMTGGFGLVAYPAKYGVSGIMTFMVNQQSVVYEKDLGPGTADLAEKITAYDPDRTWAKVELKEAAFSR
ncbi:MAG: DUF2950 domain-containing protein [Nitrospiraceae bacterium]|nr:DUF2950 domain-containing protein [Nitrospiraceae bacterium]